MAALLDVDIRVDYPGKARTLDDLKLHIGAGEIIGLAGQSGSGKSTLALSILRLLPKQASIHGHVRFRGRNLLECSASEMRRVRGREIALALQAASSALNPHLRIEAQAKEAWRAHETAPWDVGRKRLLETLAAMDLHCDESFLRRYPTEVSIGQAQRIILAMALLHRPALLITDEPTSALDILAQLELLRLLKKVNHELGASILYISHDLSTFKHLCHRLCVLNGGRVAECGTPEQIFGDPTVEFTRNLIAAHRTLNSSQQGAYPKKNDSIPS